MSDVTTFFEGNLVSYVGAAMPPAHGKLMTFASTREAYVQWTDGARQGQIDMIDLYDLAPITASETIALTNPNGPQAVRQCFASEGSQGVVNFLVTARMTEEWDGIAADALSYVAARIRAHASMDIPNEQLTPEQFDSVVVVASRALLRDAFGLDD